MVGTRRREATHRRSSGRDEEHTALGSAAQQGDRRGVAGEVGSAGLVVWRGVAVLRPGEWRGSWSGAGSRCRGQGSGGARGLARCRVAAAGGVEGRSLVPGLWGPPRSGEAHAHLPCFGDGCLARNTLKARARSRWSRHPMRGGEPRCPIDAPDGSGPQGPETRDRPATPSPRSNGFHARHSPGRSNGLCARHSLAPKQRLSRPQLPHPEATASSPPYSSSGTSVAIASLVSPRPRARSITCTTRPCSTPASALITTSVSGSRSAVRVRTLVRESRVTG